MKWLCFVWVETSGRIEIASAAKKYRKPKFIASKVLEISEEIEHKIQRVIEENE